MENCCSNQHLQRQADKSTIINIQTKHHGVIYINVWHQASGLFGRGVNCYNCPFSRGSSIPRCARPVGALPSFRAQCAMAARCLCSATASRIPSKPSSALPATRTACSHVRAAASECVQWPTQRPHCDTGGEPEHRSTPLPQPLLVMTFVIKSLIMWLWCCWFHGNLWCRFGCTWRKQNQSISKDLSGPANTSWIGHLGKHGMVTSFISKILYWKCSNYSS